jgi:hypothetical protein
MRRKINASKINTINAKKSAAVWLQLFYKTREKHGLKGLNREFFDNCMAHISQKQSENRKNPLLYICGAKGCRFELCQGHQENSGHIGLFSVKVVDPRRG